MLIQSKERQGGRDATAQRGTIVHRSALAQVEGAEEEKVEEGDVLGAGLELMALPDTAEADEAEVVAGAVLTGVPEACPAVTAELVPVVTALVEEATVEEEDALLGGRREVRTMRPRRNGAREEERTCSGRGCAPKGC